jgi:hypothetical protein
MRAERDRVLDYPLSRIMTKGGRIMTKEEVAAT